MKWIGPDGQVGPGPVEEREPTIVPCFVCGSTLERVFEDELQPSDGVMCQTHGNYGSRIFDPFQGPGLVFLVCDGCLVEREDRVREPHIETSHTVSYRAWDRSDAGLAT